MLFASRFRENCLKFIDEEDFFSWKSFTQNFPDITSNNSLGSVSAIMFQSLFDKAGKRSVKKLIVKIFFAFGFSFLSPGTQNDCKMVSIMMQ